VFVGVIVWMLLFRRLLPELRTEFTTLHTVAVAALGVAILGTGVNDGGITVWYTVTLAFTVTLSALWVDRTSHLNVIHRAAWHGTPRLNPAGRPGTEPRHSGHAPLGSSFLTMLIS
jgi:hypothetical protein